MTLLKITTMSDILSGSLVGITIVFVALTLLVLAFDMTGKMSKRSSAKRRMKAGKTKADAGVSADEVAAISMALHLFFDEAHDNESNIITIRSVERRYSPWNLKNYGFTKLNR